MRGAAWSDPDGSRPVDVPGRRIREAVDIGGLSRAASSMEGLVRWFIEGSSFDRGWTRRRCTRRGRLSRLGASWHREHGQHADREDDP